MYKQNALTPNSSTLQIVEAGCLGHGRRMSSDRKAIAERLKLTREAVGLNQAAFARLTGIEPQAINNYENGLRGISVAQATKICIATGVSLDWIFRGIAAGLPINLATALQQKQRQTRPARH
jgi:transcriptional regulator with XRE-family HTH domain